MSAEQDHTAAQPQPLLLGLLAETSIHYGADSGAGAIDLPVAREAATHYPVIAGSAFKGAFKDIFGKRDDGTASDYTGRQDQAGHLIFSDVRLLLLPVRSLAASYAWLTCPLLLERLWRDQARCDRRGAGASFALPHVVKGYYLSPNTELPAELQLEERQFERKAADGNGAGLDESLLRAVESLIANPAARARVRRQLVVLHDDDFAWFAQFALPVVAHNALDDSKASLNLWYEETLSPDTVMYGLILPRPTLPPGVQGAAMDALRGKLKARPYLQIGAGETTGLGWFAHNHGA
jgi:CRISPR-associated protein Cmr4